MRKKNRKKMKKGEKNSIKQGKTLTKIEENQKKRKMNKILDTGGPKGLSSKPVHASARGYFQ